jgi:hypothetical protein
VRGKARRLWLDLHIYTGLACAGYLVLYGVSSILLNHPTWFEPPTPATREWQASVPLTDARSKLQRAEAMRDALGLEGNVPNRRVRETERGGLEFLIWRPGARYEIEVDSAGQAHVFELRASAASVIKNLHGVPGYPGSIFGWGWNAYTHFSLFALPFLAASGALLWWSSPLGRARVWVLCAGASTFVIGFMIVWVL